MTMWSGMQAWMLSQVGGVCVGGGGRTGVCTCIRMYMFFLQRCFNVCEWGGGEGGGRRAEEGG